MKKAVSFIIAVALIVVGCVLVAGCTSTETSDNQGLSNPEQTPEQTSEELPDVAYTVTVSKEGSADYNVGDIFALEIPANPTTGYDWNITEGAENLYQKFNNYDEVYGNNPGLAGAGIVETFWFQPEDEGDKYITLKYFRSWEGEESAIASVTYHMHVVRLDSPIADGPKTTFVYDSYQINPSAGSYVKIVTKGNPTTGYFYTGSGEGLKIIETYDVDDEHLLGSSGQYAWYVTADTPGDYTFKAVCKKAGSEDEVSSFTVPLKFT